MHQDPMYVCSVTSRVWCPKLSEAAQSLAFLPGFNYLGRYSYKVHTPAMRRVSWSESEFGTNYTILLVCLIFPTRALRARHVAVLDQPPWRQYVDQLQIPSCLGRQIYDHETK